MNWLLAMGGLTPPENLTAGNSDNYKFWITLCAVIIFVIGLFMIVVPLLRLVTKKINNDPDDKSDE